MIAEKVCGGWLHWTGSVFICKKQMIKVIHSLEMRKFTNKSDCYLFIVFQTVFSEKQWS